LLAEGHAADGERARVEEPGAAQVQHDFGDAAGEKHLNGRMIPRPVRERVDDAWHAAVDIRPVASGRAAQPGGMRNRRHVQDEIPGSAKRLRLTRGGRAERFESARPPRPSTGAAEGLAACPIFHTVVILRYEDCVVHSRRAV
jgi:hypothetical protein